MPSDNGPSNPFIPAFYHSWNVLAGVSGRVHINDPFHVPNGAMTRSKTKELKEALSALVLKVSTKSELKGPFKYQEETLVQEGSNTTLFGP